MSINLIGKSPDRSKAKPNQYLLNNNNSKTNILINQKTVKSNIKNINVSSNNSKNLYISTANNTNPSNKINLVNNSNKVIFAMNKNNISNTSNNFGNLLKNK